ncbi:hypothetical protein G7K_2077-t1 [Saitoella complicata NRRL Y-17804]|uniref:Uncharacterized protein n=1 Tax=Saitoella complicata (strain BCRC 22490 / CBS 7301 / JCM 7358 / NBRC 10748 / NRRL Y-17804) TaxID=698492 RepID=A0A0E9NDV5_SAICN|nr:hypothetical protein G7K_2077-t1 [Saitoella complicata NRRL Y-17804]
MADLQPPTTWLLSNLDPAAGRGWTEMSLSFFAFICAGESWKSLEDLKGAYIYELNETKGYLIKLSDIRPLVRREKEMLRFVRWRLSPNPFNMEVTVFRHTSSLCFRNSDFGAEVHDFTLYGTSPMMLDMKERRPRAAVTSYPTIPNLAPASKPFRAWKYPKIKGHRKPKTSKQVMLLTPTLPSRRKSKHQKHHPLHKMPSPTAMSSRDPGLATNEDVAVSIICRSLYLAKSSYITHRSLPTRSTSIINGHPSVSSMFADKEFCERVHDTETVIGIRWGDEGCISYRSESRSRTCKTFRATNLRTSPSTSSPSHPLSA